MDAQTNLGYMYDVGEGVAEDKEKAVEWYLKAATQGNARAQYLLGLSYDAGEGVEEDDEKAVKWYKKAAEQGYTGAQNDLGVKYSEGEGVLQNEAQAIKWFKKASKSGNSTPYSNLAKMYRDEANKDTSRELEYWKKSYESGDFDAGFHAARIHLSAENSFYYPEAAFEILEEIRESGHRKKPGFASSLALMSHMYIQGIHVGRDYSEALILLNEVNLPELDFETFELLIPFLNQLPPDEQTKKYADGALSVIDEHCSVQLRATPFIESLDGPLWTTLQNIKFTDSDLVTRCFDGFIGGVENKMTSDDQLQAALAYRLGIPGFIASNEAKSFNYMLMAAESESQPNLDAMFWIGLFYYSGYGTNKNAAAALSWYQKAADIGHAHAINAIGMAHEKGELGFEPDLEQAFDHYKKSYHQDETCYLCMTNLGRMYQDGSVKKDLSLSKIYYTKASKSGDMQAGNLLASLEVEGLAGPENISSAIAVLKDVLLGNKAYKLSVGQKLHDKEIASARLLLASLGALDKPKAALNLGEYHALIIGNSNYENLVNLPTAKNDASEIAELLEQDYGFSVELAIDVTRNETLNSLNRFRRELKANDNFLLYYAGHGVIDELGKGHWQPVNVAKGDDCVECISNDTIKSTLKKFKANNILLIADSCFAGTITRGFGRVEEVALEELPPPDTGDTLLERLNRLKSRIAMTSGGLEPVADRIGFSEHSVFAESLIEALKNNSQVIKSGDIFEKVRQRVVTISADANMIQTPEHSQIIAAGHEGGDFIFERVSK